MRRILTYIAGAKKEYCEDAIYADERTAFVLDGATGITGQRVTDAPSDAAWFVRRFRAYLISALEGDEQILSLLRRGTRAIGAEFLRFPGADRVEDKPSAVLSVVRERKGFLEYYSLGDTEIVIRKKSGEVVTLLDSRLVDLDNRNFARMKEIAERTGKTIREAFFDVFPYILENRKKMNTPDGYCALSHTEAGLDTALQGRIPLEEVRDLMLFSDGFAEIYDLFGLYKSPEQMIEDVSANGIVPAIRRLHAAQDADPDCERFVRNKLRDDISVIYAQI